MFIPPVERSHLKNVLLKKLYIDTYGTMKAFLIMSFIIHIQFELPIFTQVEHFQCSDA